MPRSSYVYLYVLAGDQSPVAVFTVKQEALWWYSRHAGDRALRFMRLRDGENSEPLWLDPGTGKVL